MKLLDGRFELGPLAGSGGMGSVYRAFDHEAHRGVAVKVLRDAQYQERFRREARLLDELRYPGIVGYIADGTTPDGELFLAMEWLDGEDLAQRLNRAPLSLEESLTVVRYAAEALGAAHARGVVHRDIKPSNLFLVGGDPASLKVLDFGIAIAIARTRTVTRTGAIIGTVGYLAPEQARGDRDITPRVDVFALGCVLYECLAGRPAFLGSNVVAMLARLLFEEAPLLGESRPDLTGSALEVLVARLLARDPKQRPADGRAVAEALRSFRLSDRGGTAPPRATSGLEGSEQRLVSVVLAEPARTADVETFTPDSFATETGAVMEIAKRHGAEAARLPNGGFLVGFPPGEHALRAARCALALADLLAHMNLALATGRAQATGRIVVGPAIDRAVSLLAGPKLGVRIDDVTEALLPARFEVQAGVLVGERDEAEPRRLLGKPTPCVGRDKELAALEATWSECIEDQVARSVLVVAPPGMGKSRIAAELSARAASRGRVLIARADPMSAGSPLGLVQELVRRGGKAGGEFLAELIGEPVDQPSEILRAARAEPGMMREHKRRAFLEWISERLADGPLLCVLEDLHWGDVASIGYIEEALRLHSEKPLFVLALARDEVHETFARLWPGLHEIVLGPLTRRAGERLVRAVLGASADEDTVARLVLRSDGNAFYLEELIRFAAEGRSGEPETVLAMVEARLERLPPEARRALQAASVFGETFRRVAIEALVQDAAVEPLLSDDLVLETGGGELRFHHALVRDAAYATIPDDEKRRAHRRAAEWLERAEVKDGVLLGEHWERAGEPARAIPWFVVACRAALSGGNLDGTIRLAERSLALGANGPAKGHLALLVCECAMMRDDWHAALRTAVEAGPLLPEGSPEWWTAAAARLFSAQHLRDPSAREAALVIMSAPVLEPVAQGALALSLVATGCAMLQNEPVARAALERLPDQPNADLGYRAYQSRSRFYYTYAFGDRLDDLARHTDEFHRCIEVLRDSSWLLWTLYDRGLARLERGANAAAKADFEQAISISTEMGAVMPASYAWIELAWAALASGDGTATGEAALSHVRASRTPILAAMGDALDVALRLHDGRREDAERLLENLRGARMFVVPILARIEIAHGQHADALARVEEFLPRAPTFKRARRVTLLVLRAEALHGLGRIDDAYAAIRAARDHVLAVASTAEDDVARATYLANVVPAARALALAREWLGEL